jgi:hypothetical protein
MKRYDVIGEPTFDFIDSKDGGVIFYNDYVDFISARIKELQIKLINTNPKRKETVLRRQEVIDELKNLLK